MKLTKEQLNQLKNLDLSGKGGKENEIAGALNHERVNQPLIDARCLDTGQLYEYKKQSGTQWFDVHKLARLTEAQRQLPILFVVHKGGKFKALYESTYQGVIDSIGFTAEQWQWARNSPDGVQGKYAFNLKSIQKFGLLAEA